MLIQGLHPAADQSDSQRKLFRTDLCIVIAAEFILSTIIALRFILHIKVTKGTTTKVKLSSPVVINSDDSRLLKEGEAVVVASGIDNHIHITGLPTIRKRDRAICMQMRNGCSSIHVVAGPERLVRRFPEDLFAAKLHRSRTEIDLQKVFRYLYISNGTSDVRLCSSVGRACD